MAQQEAVSFLGVNTAGGCPAVSEILCVRWFTELAVC
jgi:hypothetical protein